MFSFFKKKKRVRARLIDNDFFQEKIMQEKKSAVVTFAAGWCGACKMQKPLIHDLADTHKDSDIIIALVDTDSERELAQAFQITSLPTTIAIAQGEIIFRQKGVLSRRQLEAIIKELK